MWGVPFASDILCSFETVSGFTYGRMRYPSHTRPGNYSSPSADLTADSWFRGLDSGAESKITWPRTSSALDRVAVSVSCQFEFISYCWELIMPCTGIEKVLKSLPGIDGGWGWDVVQNKGSQIRREMPTLHVTVHNLERSLLSLTWGQLTSP